MADDTAHDDPTATATSSTASSAPDDPAPTPGFDRRTFLKVAGVQSGLFAAGAGSAAAATSETARRRAPWLGLQAPDVAVVGGSAWGGWIALNLQQLGANVTVIDAWGPGNSRATSGDESRGLRSSYGDRGERSELWSSWAREAIRRWRHWDEDWGTELNMRLFFHTGDVIFRNDADDNFIMRNREVWDRIGTPYEVLTPEEAKYRYPAIEFGEMQGILYEPEAGVGRARRSCEAVAEVFQHRGGELVIARANPGSHENGRLNDLTMRPGTPLAAGTYVFACGPWMGKVFPEVLGNRIRTPLGHVVYFGTPAGDNRFTHPNLPSWNFPGVTGWPSLGIDNRGFRVRGGGGGFSRATDPDESERWFGGATVERQREFVAEHFPGLADAPVLQTHACHYEISSSRNFIIAPHPDWSNVWLAGGGSAEGFKFAPVVGEYVARRVLGIEDDPELAAAFAIPEDEFETDD